MSSVLIDATTYEIQTSDVFVQSGDSTAVRAVGTQRTSVSICHAADVKTVYIITIKINETQSMGLHQPLVVPIVCAI